jgi:hypothetical protein
MFVTGGKRLFFLAAISLTEQSNVLNFAHTDMHANRKAGRRDQHDNGKDNG